MAKIIDTHSHILPGIDDGAGSWKEALCMLKTAQAQGIRRVIATPHWGGPFGYTDPVQIRELCFTLQEKARRHNISVKIYQGQEAFGTLLGAVREHYDYIIVDTPPIGSIIDAAIVAKQCDGAVLVFESELVSSKEAARVKEQLLMTGCRLIGAVLNKVDVKKNKYYHRYDYYYHGYQEKKEVTKKNKEK